MTWPGWHEPIVLGRGELAAVALAHAIVLGIALLRYVVVPRLARGRSAEPPTPG